MPTEEWGGETRSKNYNAEPSWAYDSEGRAYTLSTVACDRLMMQQLLSIQQSGKSE